MTEYSGGSDELKILAVSNHTGVLEELERELSGFYPEAEIITETDALMAGKYAFNHEVDIVFAEADMKRMNGFQLIQFVRQEHPRVRSYLIGAEKELSESVLSGAEDVTGVLHYPLEENAVREILIRS